MTTVYVVTTGAYSDFSINQIFSTEELAQAYIDKREFGPSDYAEIEEYILDNVDMNWLKDDHNYYKVFIKKKTADVSYISVSESTEIDLSTENEHYYIFNVRAKSREHAAKIAMETRSIKLSVMPKKYEITAHFHEHAYEPYHVDPDLGYKTWIVNKVEIKEDFILLDNDVVILFADIQFWAMGFAA